MISQQLLMHYRKNLFNNHATRKGQINNGNTLLKITRNAPQKLTSDLPLSGEKNRHRNSSTDITQQCIGSQTAALPPNFEVITAAAVAVGQIIHHYSLRYNLIEAIKQQINRESTPDLNQQQPCVQRFRASNHAVIPYKKSAITS